MPWEIYVQKIFPELFELFERTAWQLRRQRQRQKLGLEQKHPWGTWGILTSALRDQGLLIPMWPAIIGHVSLYPTHWDGE